MFKVNDRVISKEFGEGKVYLIDYGPENKYWYPIEVVFNKGNTELYTITGNYYVKDCDSSTISDRDIKLLEGINENN